MADGRWQLQHVGICLPEPHWHLGPQSHEHHELIVLLAGVTQVRIGERAYRAEEGELLIYRRGVRHEEWNDPGHPFRSIFLGFDGSDLPDHLPDRLADTAGRVRQIASWLHAERDGKRPEEEAMRDSFFQALVCELLRLAIDKELPVIRQVRAYVRRHLAAPLTVDLLAGLVGLSKYHFIRYYKTATGRTPMADVRAMRLEAARDLILTSRRPFKQIADLCGLGNPPHFSLLMRNHFGVSPRRLRGGG